ncbi:MAG: tetraacyldisaccharide 4'-kinase [Pseudomonadota bacterium]
MKEPWFWKSDALLARGIALALSPLGHAYTLAQQLKHRYTKGYRANAKIICIGNVTLGGTGKTPFSIALAKAILVQHEALRGKIFFLTRGYGGSEPGPLLVDLTNHGAEDVGDEALLLARHFPTIVAKSRVEGAKLCTEKDAKLIIMDDGFQNPSVERDLDILLLGTKASFGNGHVFPAGPLREPLRMATSRAGLVVQLDGTNPLIAAPPAWRAHVSSMVSFANTPVVAFCGIANPERFFQTAKQAGADLVANVAFPDHHPISPQELRELRKTAKAKSAQLLTTEKDLMRLPAGERADIVVLPITITLEEEAAFVQNVMAFIDRGEGWSAP